MTATSYFLPTREGTRRKGQIKIYEVYKIYRVYNKIYKVYNKIYKVYNRCTIRVGFR